MQSKDKNLTRIQNKSQGNASSSSLAEIIGTAVGEFIALVHDWSRSNPNGILDVFDKNSQAKKMVADLKFNRLVAALEHSDKDDLPLLSDFEVDQSNIQVILKLMDEYCSQLMSARVPGHVLLMGDLWHENIIICANQQPVCLYVLDREFARTGLPGSEVGIFCAHLGFLVRSNQVASGPASVILRNFIDAYSSMSNRDALAQDALSHWGITYIFWAPRDPPGDKALVQDFVKEGVKYLVHSRDKDFLAQSPVKGLLPKRM